MGVNAPQLLKDNWHHFVANGATKTCTYQEMGDTVYPPGGVVSTPILSSTPNLEIVFDQRTQYFVADGSTIRSISEIAIFPSLLLPVVPKIDDLIVDPSSKEWVVKDVIQDPVDAHYELTIKPVTA